MLIVLKDVGMDFGVVGCLQRETAATASDTGPVNTAKINVITFFMFGSALDISCVGLAVITQVKRTLLVK